jgi:hypothetical protein
MRIDTKLTLLGALSVLALDAICAPLSFMGRFSYVLFLPASIAVYFWVSYRAAKYLNIQGAIAFGAFLGLVDAAIGWKISNWLGGDPSGLSKNLTFSVWCTAAFWVMIYGVLISLIAFSIATHRNNRKTS